MTNLKPHFELHFQAHHFILYQETNGSWYRAKYQEIATAKDIKRIHYNTAKWKNYIIIDIDNENLYKYRDNNLPEPNFIMKNKDKEGGHLFYVLDRGVYFKNEYYLNKWDTLQKAFTDISGGDPLNKGFVGKFINSRHFDYIELNPYAYDIDYLYSKINHTPKNNQAYNPKSFTAYKYTTKSKIKPLKSFKSLDLIAVGERNNTLFNKTRRYAYLQVLKLNQDDFKKAVLNYITKLNNSLLVELTTAEITATAKSIIKYCLNNKQSIEDYTKSDNFKNRGIMELPQEQELKEKQRLGAEYTAEQKVKKTIFKLKLSLIEMKARELKINISSLSKYSKISRPTIIKYRDKLSF